MKIGNRIFDVENNCYVMGILNITPDSFSDGGKWNNLDNAMKHTEEMILEGASIIDVGGESTRPGHIQISAQDEIERVVSVIEKIKANYDIPVSIDTYKSKVAKAALLAGADLVNDIWGLKYDEKMADLIAEFGVPCCLMHNRKNTDYRNFIEDMCEDLEESVEIAKEAGISENNIILDPGVGFVKSYEQNLMAINQLEVIKNIGYPVLLGTSKKSFIGHTLDLTADQRGEGTLVTTVIGVQKGAAFVRVHDVKENIRAIKMTQAILREGGKQSEI